MEIAMDVIWEKIASYLINRGRTVPSLGMEYGNKFIFFLGLLFCSLSITATAGNRILNVSLTNGCPYDTLTARFGTSDGLIFNHAVCVNNVGYVPYTLLVYPDKHMVKLDVREEKDLQSVYELFNEL